MGGGGIRNPKRAKAVCSQAQDRAASRSAMRSPASSIPTERRTVEAVTPSSFRRWALRPMCEESLGYESMDSTPPRLVARYQSFRLRMKLWYLATSLGGVESILSYPKLSSHIGQA